MWYIHLYPKAKYLSLSLTGGHGVEKVVENGVGRTGTELATEVLGLNKI